MGETGEAVRVKWNYLLNSYKRIKANNGKMTGRGALEKWPFYDAMESLMGTRPNISPVFVIDSGAKPREENRQPESPETPSSNAERKTPVRKRRRATSYSEDFMQGKLEVERQRLALEEKRLALEERRINLLAELVDHLKS